MSWKSKAFTFENNIEDNRKHIEKEKYIHYIKEVRL
jgi:hypothetical protein